MTIGVARMTGTPRITTAVPDAGSANAGTPLERFELSILCHQFEAAHALQVRREPPGASYARNRTLVVACMEPKDASPKVA